MARKIRIVRKTLNFRQSLGKFNNLFSVLLGIYIRRHDEAERARLLSLRADKIAKDIEVLEMRREKLMNDLVIQDLKIEETNLRLGHPVPPEWTYHGDDAP